MHPLARLMPVRAPRTHDARPCRVTNDGSRDQADRPEDEAARERAERRAPDALFRMHGRCERERDRKRRNERLHGDPPGWRADHEAKWGVSGEPAWPRRGGLEFRLQVLFENRHFERDAAIVGEQHAHELVADVQVGRVALGWTFAHRPFLADLLLEIEIELRHRLGVELGDPGVGKLNRLLEIVGALVVFVVHQDAAERFLAEQYLRIVVALGPRHHADAGATEQTLEIAVELLDLGDVHGGVLSLILTLSSVRRTRFEGWRHASPFETPLRGSAGGG